MSDTLYIVKKRKSHKKLMDVANQLGLVLCYETKREKVLKNEKILLMIKEKYAFLSVFTNPEIIMPELQKRLQSEGII